jgi:hypothetical protein
METGFMTCEMHVGVLRAIVTGVPEGACIEIGLGTIFIGLALFVLGVKTLQWAARRLLAAALNRMRPAAVNGPVWSARPKRDTGPIR